MADVPGQPAAQPQLDLGGAPPAPAPVAAAAPAAAAPAAAAEPGPAPAAPAAAAPAAAEPVPAADDLSAHPAERPTLLEKAAEAANVAAKEPPDAKAAEGGDAKPAAEAAKPAAEAAKPDGKPADKPAEAAKPVEAAKPAPAPVDFAKFTLPEALKSTAADNPNVVEFTGALQEALQNPQDAGQKLLDLHAKAMTEFAEQTRRDQIKAFNETRQGWATEVLADPQIGGAGHDTAMRAIARMRDMLVSSAQPGSKEYAADQKSLDTFLRVTGAGDHPVFMRLLHNAARYFDEPGLPPDNPQPPPSNGREGGGRKRILYDHPRSNANRQ